MNVGLPRDKLTALSSQNQAKEVSEEEQEVASVHSEDEGREYQHPEAGLKTSDFYHTKDIPERFNHPG